MASQHISRSINSWYQLRPKDVVSHESLVAYFGQKGIQASVKPHCTHLKEDTHPWIECCVLRLERPDDSAVLSDLLSKLISKTQHYVFMSVIGTSQPVLTSTETNQEFYLLRVPYWIFNFVLGLASRRTDKGHPEFRPEGIDAAGLLHKSPPQGKEGVFFLVELQKNSKFVDNPQDMVDPIKVFAAKFAKEHSIDIELHQVRPCGRVEFFLEVKGSKES